MTAVLPVSNDQTERVVAGILIALSGNIMFATSDAIVKLLTARYSVFQIIVSQALFALIPLTVIILRKGGFRSLRVRHPRLVVLRGVLAGTATVFGFYSFSQLPLAESYSIAFCTPLFVTLLSIPILGEKVGLHRWGAVLAGFVGILVMVRPGFATLHVGHAAALIGAGLGAFTVLVLRRIAREEMRAVMVLAVVTGLIVVSLPGMFLTFRMPTLPDMALFACTGLLMGSAQFFIAKSLSLAPASVIAPMQYSMILWAIIYGALLFGTRVDPIMVVGATIVIASGLYIMHRERRRGHRRR
ncbi:membrane protein [Kaistia sp. 32K]|uniref:DMT family transporter n=1 Tax=Kaistia sp. 32K TaxID=2795690 RepID=UPI001916A53B|nr:DMT family transporter [Kaistia sp. 32K]BCP54173.1 membrane protein [Kaistia sp. 32K]